MITLRLAEPHEQFPLRCNGTRARNGRVRCEMPALHIYSNPQNQFHSGRDSAGRWHFWNCP